MDERLVRFVAGLRGAGVRVSLAESQDAFAAAHTIGVFQRDRFKNALKTTLIKDRHDGPVFEELFPLYFGSAQQPQLPAAEGLSESGRQQLAKVLAALAEALREELARVLAGQPLSQQELEAAAERAGLPWAAQHDLDAHFQRQMMQELGLEQLEQAIEALLSTLAALGMSAEDRAELEARLTGNLQALSEQARQYAGLRLAEARADRPSANPMAANLMDHPFQELSPQQSEALRFEVSRLANRLRTRLALRQRRGKGRRLDAKATLRASLRHGNVPFQLIRRTRRRKARFALICDVSTSMRPVVSFLLLLMYGLQTRVGKTRSFAFIDHIEEISADFAGERPQEAVPAVLRRIPPGHYNTDLGGSLEQFERQHRSAVDRRTTLILCGDGRNNYNDPRTDLIERLGRRARRIVWFNPEPPRQWGRGDSDMDAYAPLVDEVFQVANLRQLSRAVDQIVLS